MPETTDLLPPTDAWQPLPVRGRPLFRLGHAAWSLLPGGGAGLALGVLADRPVIGVAIGVAIALAFGAWLGGRRHRTYGWKLDADGFAVRSGRLWYGETHVPATRVQHLDVKHGPLERRRGLATLVVHTAGTRMHAVSVPCLDAEDARALRTELSRRIEPAGDDD